jgi:hypothetical protein
MSRISLFGRRGRRARLPPRWLLYFILVSTRMESIIAQSPRATVFIVSTRQDELPSVQTSAGDFFSLALLRPVPPYILSCCSHTRSSAKDVPPIFWESRVLPCQQQNRPWCGRGTVTWVLAFALIDFGSISGVEVLKEAIRRAILKCDGVGLVSAWWASRIR